MRGTELVTQFVRQYPYVAFEVVGQVTRKGFTFVEFANGPHAGGHPCGTPSAIGSEEMAQIIITPSDGGDQLFVEGIEHEGIIAFGVWIAFFFMKKQLSALIDNLKTQSYFPEEHFIDPVEYLINLSKN